MGGSYLRSGCVSISRRDFPSMYSFSDGVSIQATDCYFPYQNLPSEYQHSRRDLSRYSEESMESGAFDIEGSTEYSISSDGCESG